MAILTCFECNFLNISPLSIPPALAHPWVIPKPQSFSSLWETNKECLVPCSYHHPPVIDIYKAPKEFVSKALKDTALKLFCAKQGVKKSWNTFLQGPWEHLEGCISSSEMIMLLQTPTVRLDTRLRAPEVLTQQGNADMFVSFLAGLLDDDGKCLESVWHRERNLDSKI